MAKKKLMLMVNFDEDTIQRLIELEKLLFTSDDERITLDHKRAALDLRAELQIARGQALRNIPASGGYCE